MKVWFTCAMGFLSNLKDKIMQSAGKWKDLQNIILGEVIQVQKDNQSHCGLSYADLQLLFLYICIYVGVRGAAAQKPRGGITFH